MAKRKRMEPLSLEEIENNPCASGLEKVLLFHHSDIPSPAVTTVDRPSSDEPSPERLSVTLPCPKDTCVQEPQAGIASPVLTSPDAPTRDVDTPLGQSTDRSSPDLPAITPATSVSPPEIPSPDVLTGVVPTPVSTSTAVLSGDTPSPDDPDISALLSVLDPPVRNRPYRVHYCASAQDGHSTSEDAIYQTLWTAAKTVRADDAFRVCQIPQSELAARVRITTRNLVPALLRLQEKLSIEEIRSFDRGTKTARVWKVYSYASILQRRRAAGLDWVVRDKGVRFVDPPSGAQRSPDVMRAYRTSPDAPPLSPVASALRNAPGQPLDGAFASRLIEVCRKVVPDATETEIASFIDRTIRDMRQVAGLADPAAVLLAHVPQCFEGDAFRQYRDAERQRRLLDAQRRREEKRRAQAVVDDPRATESDKSWARIVLQLPDSD